MIWYHEFCVSNAHSWWCCQYCLITSWLYQLDCEMKVWIGKVHFQYLQEIAWNCNPVWAKLTLSLPQKTCFCRQNLWKSPKQLEEDRVMGSSDLWLKNLVASPRVLKHQEAHPRFQLNCHTNFTTVCAPLKNGKLKVGWKYCSFQTSELSPKSKTMAR